MLSERRCLVQQYWKGYGGYATVGLELALSVLFGLFVGSWLDKKLGTGFLTWIGLGFGIAAGYRTLWQALRRANAEARRIEEHEREARKQFDEKSDDKR
jgi:ATP synthase protein I